MKYLKVGYSRTFPLEQFGNEKPFIEIEVEEGENPLEVFAKAKELVHQFHEQTLAEMKAKSEMQVDKKETQNQTAFQWIQNCKTLDELKQWELFAASTKNPKIKESYQEKLKQLTNEPK
jgi:hypothetical protein